MAVELDPVPTGQPTYNAFERICVVGVEPVVEEIQGAVFEQDMAVFASVKLPSDTVYILELLDTLVPRVNAVGLVQKTLGHMG